MLYVAEIVGLPGTYTVLDCLEGSGAGFERNHFRECKANCSGTGEQDKSKEAESTRK